LNVFRILDAPDGAGWRVRSSGHLTAVPFTLGPQHVLRCSVSNFGEWGLKTFALSPNGSHMLAVGLDFMLMIYIVKNGSDISTTYRDLTVSPFDCSPTGVSSACFVSDQVFILMYFDYMLLVTIKGENSASKGGISTKKIPLASFVSTRLFYGSITAVTVRVPWMVCSTGGGRMHVFRILEEKEGDISLKPHWKFDLKLSVELLLYDIDFVSENEIYCLITGQHVVRFNVLERKALGMDQRVVYKLNSPVIRGVIRRIFVTGTVWLLCTNKNFYRVVFEEDRPNKYFFFDINDKKFSTTLLEAYRVSDAEILVLKNIWKTQLLEQLPDVAYRKRFGT